MDTLLTAKPKQKKEKNTLVGGEEFVPIPDSFEGKEWDIAREAGFLMDKDGNVIDPQRGNVLSWNGKEWK